VAQLVDDGGGIVLLLRGRDAGAFVEDQTFLALRALVFLRAWDGRDELRLAPGLDEATGGLAVGV
jgi:hypothetical protein